MYSPGSGGSLTVSTIGVSLTWRISYELSVGGSRAEDDEVVDPSCRVVPLVRYFAGGSGRRRSGFSGGPSENAYPIYVVPRNCRFPAVPVQNELVVVA